MLKPEDVSVTLGRGGPSKRADLKKPRYSQTSAYGHFGRELDSFTWEKVDMVEELQNKL